MFPDPLFLHKYNWIKQRNILNTKFKAVNIKQLGITQQLWFDNYQKMLKDESFSKYNNYVEKTTWSAWGLVDAGVAPADSSIAATFSAAALTDVFFFHGQLISQN